MTTWLKKVGEIILKGVEIVSGIAPIVSASLPGSAGTVQVVSQDLAQIATVIQEVEVMGQALKQPGPQKLTAAAPLVAQIVLQSSILAGRSIANEALFTQACSEIAGGVADLLNSLKADVPTVSKT